MTDFPTSASSSVESNIAQPESPATIAPPSLGCLAELKWISSASVLACFSLTFYREAVRRPVRTAILFFIIFGIIISTLQTLAITRSLLEVGREIQAGYQRRGIPEIRITDGIAEVDGPQPLILIDEQRSLMAIDTTGTLDPKILRDTGKYQQGILLTRTKVAILNRNGRYQEMPLSQLQPLLGDPFIFNAETMALYWTGLSIVVGLVSGIGLLLWNILVRLIYLLVITLLMYGVLRLMKRPDIRFEQVLTVGLYAVVPTLLFQFLLSQLKVSLFFGLFTVCLVLAWGVALWVAFAKNPVSPIFDKFGIERPLWAWRAWLAVPLAIDIVLEIIFKWQAWYVTWPFAIATLIALIWVSLQSNRNTGTVEVTSTSPLPASTTVDKPIELTPVSIPPVDVTSTNKRGPLFWTLTVGGVIGIASLCACLGLLYVTGLGTTLKDMAVANFAFVPGTTAPEFSLPSVTGETIQLSQFRGSPTIVTFGATWCPDCQREAATLVEWQQNHPDLKIIYIDIKESPALVQEFMVQRGFKFPVLLDQEGSVAKKYYVYAIPAVFFVDREGVIRERMYETLTESQVDAALTAIGITP